MIDRRKGSWALSGPPEDLSRGGEYSGGSLPSRTATAQRLYLVPATVSHLDAELESPEALGRLPGVRVPASWPPGEYDRACSDGQRGLRQGAREGRFHQGRAGPRTWGDRVRNVPTDHWTDQSSALAGAPCRAGHP